MSEIIGSIASNLFMPVIAILISAALVIVRAYADKITKSVVAKNEIESLERTFAVRARILEVIENVVDTAVASNMQLADNMKKAGETLTADQVKQLNRSAKEMIKAALPDSTTSDGQSLLDVLGGREKLDSIIDGMIERSVYEYKVKGVVIKKTKETSQSMKPIRSPD